MSDVAEQQRLPISVTDTQLKYIKQLQKLGYGTTDTGVAKYLMMRELDDLIRLGVLQRV